MTPNYMQTGVFIHKPVDIDALYESAKNIFLECAYGVSPERGKHFQRTDGLFLEHPGAVATAVYGLTGFRMVYRTDGTQIHTQEEYLARLKECESKDCRPESHDPAHHIVVLFEHTMETTFGERNAGQVHAELLYRLGYWLDSQEAPWTWLNWLVSSVQVGYDRLPELGPLCAEKVKEREILNALAAAGPVPVDSLLGLVIMAERIAAKRKA